MMNSKTDLEYLRLVSTGDVYALEQWFNNINGHVYVNISVMNNYALIISVRNNYMDMTKYLVEELGMPIDNNIMKMITSTINNFFRKELVDYLRFKCKEKKLRPI